MEIFQFAHDWIAADMGRALVAGAAALGVTLRYI